MDCKTQKAPRVGKTDGEQLNVVVVSDTYATAIVDGARCADKRRNFRTPAIIPIQCTTSHLAQQSATQMLEASLQSL